MRTSLRQKGGSATLHQNEETSLIKAAAMGHVDVVKFLLDKGANINATEKVAALPPPHAGGRVLKSVSPLMLCF